MPRGGARKGAGRKRTKPAKQPKTPKVSVASEPQKSKPAEQSKTPEKPAQPIENPYGCSPMELIFVELYTGKSKFNASDAYLGAGFKGKPGKASGLAARLIARDRVAKAIADRLGSRLRTLQMDGDEALEGISRIGRVDVRTVFDGEGNLKPLDEWDDEAADALQSVKIVERKVIGTDEATGKPIIQYTKEIKFYDKLKARELMAKAAGKLSEFGGLKNAKGEPLAPRKVIIEFDEAPA